MTSTRAGNGLSTATRRAVPAALRPALLPVARRVFWWGEPEEWLNDAIRFVAQVMTYGDWDDAMLTRNLLGDAIFREVLETPPSGVFDIKSWHYWHSRYHLVAPPLPTRKL